MRFGFFMMPLHSNRENPTLAFERDLQLIEYAESLGFDEFWVGSHNSGGWETIPAPDIFLAAAATRTTRIRLGTAVISLPYHHPFQVAERMAFLDHLAYGRVMMGVGPGAMPSDTKMFDLEIEELRPMMKESLDIILKLYNEEGAVSYEGEYWQISEMEVQVKPLQQPHMPIVLVSSGSGNSLKVAGERGLPVISGVFSFGTIGIADQWGVYEKHSSAAGHAVSRDDWRLSTAVYVADSTEEAREDIREGVLDEVRQYWVHSGAGPTYQAYPEQPVDEITLEQIIDKRRWIVGDPDYCVQQIKELEADTGGFGGLLMITTEWTSTQSGTDRWSYSPGT